MYKRQLLYLPCLTDVDHPVGIADVVDVCECFPSAVPRVYIMAHIYTGFAIGGTHLRSAFI